jgi:hypothetical protein
MFDPTLGRFLQRDTIVSPDPTNLYQFVSGTPTNRTDPLGEVDVEVTGLADEKDQARLRQEILKPAEAALGQHQNNLQMAKKLLQDSKDPAERKMLMEVIPLIEKAIKVAQENVTFLKDTTFYVGKVNGKTVVLMSFSDRSNYLCHGYTFRSKIKGGGERVLTPMADSVDVILKEAYENVPLEKAKKGDVLVWRARDGTIIHTAKLAQDNPVVKAGTLHPDTKIDTKNGAEALQTGIAISTLGAGFESPEVWREK